MGIGFCGLNENDRKPEKIARGRMPLRSLVCARMQVARAKVACAKEYNYVLSQGEVATRAAIDSPIVDRDELPQLSSESLLEVGKASRPSSQQNIGIERLAQIWYALAHCLHHAFCYACLFDSNV